VGEEPFAERYDNGRIGRPQVHMDGSTPGRLERIEVAKCLCKL
jgi:hypothetical protein